MLLFISQILIIRDLDDQVARKQEINKELNLDKLINGIVEQPSIHSTRECIDLHRAVAMSDLQIKSAWTLAPGSLTFATQPHQHRKALNPSYQFS